MNIFKAAFCRAFQQGFRIMYPFFPYREPEELRADSDIPNICPWEDDKDTSTYSENCSARLRK